MIRTDGRCAPLRILYVEDNPLIAFHVEQIVEDLGHIFVGSIDSFAELKATLGNLEVEGVLLDMDLADGPTGPAAAAWLREMGVPTIFVTGQEGLAEQHRDLALAVLVKPITHSALQETIQLFRTGKASSSRSEPSATASVKTEP
jgi:AmiR/NasT family two-component response regulator